MAIQLTDHVWPGKTVKSGTAQAIVIPPGKMLKVETTPDGEELLSAVCPQGKNWSARIIVEITETTE